jgi:hypothetical protein
MATALKLKQPILLSDPAICTGCPMYKQKFMKTWNGIAFIKSTKIARCGFGGQTIKLNEKGSSNRPKWCPLEVVTA